VCVPPGIDLNVASWTSPSGYGTSPVSCRRLENPCYGRALVPESSPPRPRLGLAEVGRVLAGDAAARRHLVDVLLPIVHVRVARRLPLTGHVGGSVDRLRVEDFTQDVFEHLFRNDGRVLGQWAPERGMSLENYVGMIAEQRVGAALRSRRRNPWTEEPTCVEQIEAAIPAGRGPYQEVAARQLLERVVAKMRSQLTPRGQELFERLILHEQPAAEVAGELEMQLNAVHAWSSRLKRRLRTVMHALQQEPERTRGPEAS